MAEHPERYVCDLTTIMRTRLLFGLYNNHAVSPRWRRLAQTYCITLSVAFLYHRFHSRLLYMTTMHLSYFSSILGHVLLTIFCSLWTGDEYIHNFFTKNSLTDNTLDSPIIFNGLMKQIKQFFMFNLVLVSPNAVMTVFASKFDLQSIIIQGLIVLLHLVVSFGYSTKLLVMALFNARMLVLKRRLQRKGFRAPPEPYCQIYDEIWQMLDATNNPLRAMLFCDLVFTCSKLICMSLIIVYETWSNVIPLALVVHMGCWVLHTLFLSCGHVVLLESAAVHCEDMAIFTVTQLIKNPTAAERVRMCNFLRALERRGARYHVLRVLPLDARLLLRLLGFCTAQVLVFVNTIIES